MNKHLPTFLGKACASVRTSTVVSEKRNSNLVFLLAFVATSAYLFPNHLLGQSLERREALTANSMSLDLNVKSFLNCAKPHTAVVQIKDDGTGKGTMDLQHRKVNVLSLTGEQLNRYREISFSSSSPSSESPLVVLVDAEGAFVWQVPKFMGVKPHQGTYVVFYFQNTASLAFEGEAAWGQVLSSASAAKKARR